MVVLVQHRYHVGLGQTVDLTVFYVFQILSTRKIQLMNGNQRAREKLVGFWHLSIKQILLNRQC